MHTNDGGGGVSPRARGERKGRKPWQLVSDHTPSGHPIAGWLKFPGQPTGQACADCRVAVKRVRRQVIRDGRSVKAKVSICPRCQAWSGRKAA